MPLIQQSVSIKIGMKDLPANDEYGTGFHNEDTNLKIIRIEDIYL